MYEEHFADIKVSNYPNSEHILKNGMFGHVISFQVQQLTFFFQVDTCQG